MTITNDPAGELKALRNLLESHNRSIEERYMRWAFIISQTPEHKREAINERFERQKAKDTNTRWSYETRITALEQQLAREAEEKREQEAKRAWIKPIKQKALQEWLRHGGSSSGFEASWPEMERQIFMQNTLESLGIEPEPPKELNAVTKAKELPAASTAEQTAPKRRDDPAAVNVGKPRNWKDRPMKTPPVDPRLKKP